MNSLTCKYALKLHLICILLFLTVNGQSLKNKPKRFNHGFGLNIDRPLNIAHRGASGIYPENTVAAFEKGIKDGADVIECDLGITKDLNLICIHEMWLSHSTNIANIQEFANRKNTYYAKGEVRNDWFTVDFTLEELSKVNVIQAFEFRDQSFNNNFTIATFDEYVRVAKTADRPIGIYPEIKNPDFVNSHANLLPNGTRFEDIVIMELTKHGYTEKEDKCLIQCFEEESLLYLKEVVKTKIPLMQCIYYDVDDSALDRWRDYDFYGVCCWKDQIYRNYRNGTYKNYIFEKTNLVEKCHNRGLKVHTYTFRNEDRFLGWDYGQDINKEYQIFYQLGIEGYFTDFPASLKNYLDTIYIQDIKCDHSTSASSLVRWTIIKCIFLVIFCKMVL